MFKKSLASFAKIPFPDRTSMEFVEELHQPVERRFSAAKPGQFVRGLTVPLNTQPEIPETASKSLRSVLAGRNIPENTNNGIKLRIKQNKDFIREEFALAVSETEVCITAAEPEGVRGAVYKLEELLTASCDGKAITADIHQKPFIKNRISRCCFSPINREPLYLDELTDDVDYYPENYLDRLAHERINGLWITVYLRDFPSSIFPEHGDSVEKRLQKLRKAVKACSRYGIKCYIFLAEPKAFHNTYKAFSDEDEKAAPEIIGHKSPSGRKSFCTSTTEGKEYLRESIEYIFRNVPGLGGIINIMCLESASPCGTWQIYSHVEKCNCPRCSKLRPEAIFPEIACVMRDAMRKYEPEAEFIGWFYFAWFLPGDPENKPFLKIAENWPHDTALMFNFECGGVTEQLGKPRAVLDYSLSYIGPSQLWQDMAQRTRRPAAKLQVCNSHEDASVPIIPVPGNLFLKYKELYKTRCDTVMQCWYFGNFPGIMNKAAGRLSFAPFPESEDDFLLELAASDWRENSSLVVKAWKYFSDSYQNFPENLNMKWVGTLHFSVIFPWYIFPVDTPMMMSYTQRFPKIGGDRIGECIGYEHTRSEALELFRTMEVLWQKGMEIMSSLKSQYCDDIECLKDIGLAEAIGIQISSSRRFFEFYQLREKMIFERIDLRPQMKNLIHEEIADTLLMKKLCEADSRIGYHAEVESYLFFPEKLQARIELLKELLKSDFPRFDYESRDIRNYAGDIQQAEDINCLPESEQTAWYNVGEVKFRVYSHQNTLVFDLKNVKNFQLEFEPCRLAAIKYYSFSDGKFMDTGIKKTAKIHQDDDNMRIEIDLNAFQSFRYSKKAPVRFNLTCDGESFRKRHPLPARLCCGDCNPHDLCFIHFV